MTVDELLDRAGQAKDDGDPEQAIALYTAALKLRPAECEALVERGNCYCALDRFQEAITDFRTALLHEREPATRAIIRYNVGNALMDLGQVAAALADYDVAVQLDPTFGWAHHGRGHALSALGRHADSLAAYTESARLLPGQPLPLNGIAVALAELGRHAEALAAFDAVLRVEPTMKTAQDNRALLLKQMAAAREG